MKYLSLFSGIEAATVAWHPLGWECAGVSEIEPFPCAVLAHHYPNVPNLGDVTRITEAQVKALGHIDIVVFGSPCQDLSVAGHRKGLINADGTVTRSGLFFTAVNIARWSGARFWLWENVPGAFSSNKGRDFASVVEFMAGLDDVPVPEKGWGTEGAAVGDNGLLEWGVLDAQWFGVAQRRRRVFALLDTGDWADRPPILLEPEGMRGDSAPRREAGEEVTPTIRAGAPNGSAGHGARSGARSGDSKDELIVQVQPYTVANTLTQRMHKGINSTLDEGQTPVVAFCPTQDPLMAGGPVAFDTTQITSAANYSNPKPGDPCHPLAAGAHPPVIAFHPTQDPISSTDGSTHAMGCGSKGGTASVAVAYGIRSANTSSNGWGISEELTHTLDQAQPHAVGYSIMPMNSGKDYKARETEVAQPHAVAFAQNTRNELREMSVVGALAAEPGMKQTSYIRQSMQVRRLTPTECERLQGFPDGYTNIPWRKSPTAPDGPRYKALGNSMAVPVMRWIGQQIEGALL